VVDGETAFCGGINILDDFHDPNHGGLSAPRFDFAVRVRGPLVTEMDDTMSVLWQRMQAARRLRANRLTGALESLRDSHATPPPQRVADAEGSLSRAALVLRDNVLHRTSIERTYRRAISMARSEVIIANAYFVPGRKMRKALIRAAQSGVRVQLLLQGKYEYFMQYYSSRPVYSALLEAGVEIHEYSPSFLHAKVAVVDGHWATVGSSNLDPLSMLLAREANVMVDDAAFAGALRTRLLRAMQEAGTRMDPRAVCQPLAARTRAGTHRAGPDAPGPAPASAFHANDNIAAFIEPGRGRRQDEGRAESLVIDTDSDHNTNDTAKRVAKMFIDEVFRGRYRAAPR
jgi:cardiolipin synthase